MSPGGEERGGQDGGEERCRFSEKEAFDFGGTRVRMKETDCDSEGERGGGPGMARDRRET